MLYYVRSLNPVCLYALSLRQNEWEKIDLFFQKTCLPVISGNWITPDYSEIRWSREGFNYSDVWEGIISLEFFFPETGSRRASCYIYSETFWALTPFIKLKT